MDSDTLIFFTLYFCQSSIWKLLKSPNRMDSTLIRVDEINPITGRMYLRHNYLLHYLEGPKERVIKSLRQLRSDFSHQRFRILTHGQNDFRLFGDWSAHWVKPNSHSPSPQSLIDLFETVISSRTTSPQEINLMLCRFGQNAVPMSSLKSFDTHNEQFNANNH